VTDIDIEFEISTISIFGRFDFHVFTPIQFTVFLETTL